MGLTGQERELGEGRQQCRGQAPLALCLSTAVANPAGLDLGRARKAGAYPSRMENMARRLLERFWGKSGEITSASVGETTPTFLSWLIFGKPAFRL